MLLEWFVWLLVSLRRVCSVILQLRYASYGQSPASLGPDSKVTRSFATQTSRVIGF